MNPKTSGTSGGGEADDGMPVHSTAQSRRVARSAPGKSQPGTLDEVLSLLWRAARGDKTVNVPACRILLERLEAAAEDTSEQGSVIDELAERRQVKA